MGSILLILPCARTIKYGSYFLSKTWNNVIKILRRRGVDLSRIQFAAIDCIVTFLNSNDDRRKYGSIVLAPQEMSRVAGKDHPPYWKIVKKHIRELIVDTEVGLRRVSGFDYIITLVNVNAYKIALFTAITNLDLWWKTAFVLIPSSIYMMYHGAKVVAHLIKKYEVKGKRITGVITTRKALITISRYRDVGSVGILQRVYPMATSTACISFSSPLNLSTSMSRSEVLVPFIVLDIA